MQIPLILPNNQAHAINLNLFYDPGALYGRPALVNTPGFTELPITGYSTAPSGQVRGILWYDNHWYLAIHNKFYKCNTDGSVDDEETLATTTGEVKMVASGNADLGKYVLIYEHSGATTSKYNVATGLFTQGITVPAAGAGIAYQDGFFLTAGADEVYPSDLDSVAWTDYDPISPKGYPDDIINIVSLGRRIYVFGEQSVEVYYNSGDVTAPFERINGGTIPIGSASLRSHQVVGNSIYWTTPEGRIARTRGTGQYEYVSHPLIDEVYHLSTQKNNANAFYIPYMGHDWYCLKQYSDPNSIFVFDATVAELGLFPWFRWTGSTGTSSVDINCAEMGSVYLDAATTQRVLVGTLTSGKVFVLDPDVHYSIASDGDVDLTKRTMWYLPPIREDRRMIQHHGLEIEMKEGEDGMVNRLELSDNRSKTWKDKDDSGWAVLGNITSVSLDYDQRFQWWGLGQSVERAYRWYSDSALERIIFGATLKATVGT